MQRIKVRRGLKVNLPVLAIGELAYCTDTKELYIGTALGNEKINENNITANEITLGNFKITFNEIANSLDFIINN